MALTGLGLSLLGACRSPSEPPGLQPTEPRLLSAGSPTKDEDPSVLLGRDGRLYVAWFSDRGGNADIYLATTIDGVAWTGPTRITTDPGGDFYPNLFQDASGTFHLVWFRWTQINVGHIYHNQSADGLTWSPATEEQATKAFDVDDWVPTITQAPDGTLLVYFVAARRDTAVHNSELYLATRPPGAAAWTAVTRLSTLSSPSANDHLPFVARTAPDRLTLVWERHDSTQATPWLNPKSDLYYATSSDGVAWTAPTRITNDTGAVVNLYPAVYRTTQGNHRLLWLSTRGGVPHVLDLAADSLDAYPAAVSTLVGLPGAGYSHRVAPTTTAGLYLGVWVQGPDGAQDIYYRFFRP